MKRPQITLRRWIAASGLVEIEFSFQILSEQTDTHLGVFEFVGSIFKLDRGVLCCGQFLLQGGVFQVLLRDPILKLCDLLGVLLHGLLHPGIVLMSRLKQWFELMDLLRGF